MTDEEIIVRMAELRELLKEFGVVLGGYDPGILAFLKSTGCSLHFDQAEWGWIEPLLTELRKYRTERQSALSQEEEIEEAKAEL